MYEKLSMPEKLAVYGPAMINIPSIHPGERDGVNVLRSHCTISQYPTGEVPGINDSHALALAATGAAFIRERA